MGGLLVAAIGRPAVVHRHALEAGQHPGPVHRLPASLGVHGEQAEPVGAGRVQPVQPARHPGAGLVEVGHRRGRQLCAHRVDEAVQPVGALGQDRGHGAAGHLGADQVGQRLGGALNRQVLLAVQVGDRGADPRTVAGRGAYPIGERRGCHRPAATAAPLGSMLGDQQATLWQVVDLPGLDAHHPGVGQLAAAALAAFGGVHHDHVRMLDLGQVRAGSAGLTAGLASGPGLGGAAAGPIGLGRALGQPVSRRRLGGVGGVGPQPRLKLDDLCVELADTSLEGGDHRIPGDELGPQPGDGGRSSRVRRSRRRIARHADADRVPALLVRRARPWQAETGTAASSGSTQPSLAQGVQPGQRPGTQMRLRAATADDDVAPAPTVRRSSPVIVGSQRPAVGRRPTKQRAEALRRVELEHPAVPLRPDVEGAKAAQRDALAA
jgi:hypothetical protein